MRQVEAETHVCLFEHVGFFCHKIVYNGIKSHYYDIVQSRTKTFY